MIQEIDNVVATTADLLSSGRLNAIPYNGLLTIELLAQFNDATNNYTVTIQLPDGSVPIDAQKVPGCNPALAGVLDDRQLLRHEYPATQGGHFTVTLTETGTAVCAYRITLQP